MTEALAKPTPETENREGIEKIAESGEKQASSDPSPQPDWRPRWALFDEIWYRTFYRVPDARASYHATGAGSGHSPNTLFDEWWYISRYPDVRAHVAEGRIASGFEHYCQTGHRDRSPNAYFDEGLYRKRYPALFAPGGVVEQRNYVNGYHHYLAEGGYEGRSPGRFFDEHVWSRHRGNGSRTSASGSALEQHLTELREDRAAGLIPTSWYFDPKWYLSNCSEAGAEWNDGWASPLSHYLGSEQGRLLDPNPLFDEDWYRHLYQDVDAAIAGGLYRNGFDHFISAGSSEGRLPSPDFELNSFDETEVMTEVGGGLYPDSFAFYVARRSEPVPFLTAAEIHGKRIFRANARLTAKAACRETLDFTVPADRNPTVSVVVVLHNQFDLTMTSLVSLHAQRCDLQLVLVDSGSTDQTREIEKYVTGAQVFRLPDNVGYIAGCNLALQHVRAELLLFMNNDVVVAPGALRAALSRIASRPDAGAVGGRVVRSHGKIQEAGCIVWRDGRTTGYLRDRDPDVPEAGFVREVDFCSAVFLLTRTAAIQALGGFSTAFRPAYYEDADLGIRLRDLGYVTVYDPAVLVHHYEYGSSERAAAEAMMATSRATFRTVHASRLREQFNYRGTEYVRARSRRRGQKRILFVEDRIPRRSLGSGYVRSIDIICAMAALDYAVTVFPMAAWAEHTGDDRADFPDTVELLHDRTAAAMPRFLAERAGEFDVVWVCRTHNLDRLLSVLAVATGAVPDFGIVLDTEAVVAPRQFGEVAIARRSGTLPPPALAHDEISQALVAELASAGICRHLVAVSAADAAMISFAGHDEVSVLGHCVEAIPTERGFGERAGLLFVGSLHGTTTPNYDSLLWFIGAVLPLVIQEIGDTSLTIVGHVAPGVDTTALSGHPGIRFVGPIDDLTPFYDSHRVFVAPTRFAAGLPYKVHEAAARGIPVVASSLLCDQLGWTSGVELLDGGDDDPAAFARATALALTRADLWQRLRAGALNRIVRDHGPAQYTETIAAILAAVVRPPD